MTARRALVAPLLTLACARVASVGPGADAAPTDVTAPPDAAPPDAATPDAAPPDAAPPDAAIACRAVGARTCVSPRARSVCDADGFERLSDCPDRTAATGFCDEGTCRIACAPGAFDCDDDDANGCESRSACPDVMLRGFGGSTGYGPDSQCLHASDNGSYAGPLGRDGEAPVAVDLTPAFGDRLSLFGVPLRAVYVNVNGNVSVGRAIEDPTPRAFPIAGQVMIAPWWADVDTRGGGQPSRNSVCFALRPRRLIVTWLRVGHFDRSDERSNSFQLVVRTDLEECPTNEPSIEFRYARCEWTVGDPSVGVAAQGGFDVGNLRNYVTLPQSRTAAMADLCRTTNVPGGPPGLFRFTIRGSGCLGNI